MTTQFKIKARLHSIIPVHRANNEIIFVSPDRLTEEFRALRSKHITLIVAESNGHAEPAQGALLLPVADEPKPEPQLIVIAGQPIGKPRMTQADKKIPRPVVTRFWAWAKKARNAAKGKLPAELTRMTVDFFIQMPDSWDVKKRLQHDGQHHHDRPDLDNLCKSVMDALWEDDQVIAEIVARKFWVNDNPRTEVFFS